MRWIRPQYSRILTMALLISGLLLASVTTLAAPVLDYGSLHIYSTNNIYNSSSFTTDGVSNFSGGSDSISGGLFTTTVQAHRWGKYASGHVDLTLNARSEQDWDYQQYGTYRAKSHHYTVNANLLFGFDERYKQSGIDDTYQWRAQYAFNFDIEIRWHSTTRGIEPQGRLTAFPSYTTAYFCQKLIELQGGCASTSPGTQGSTLKVSTHAYISRAKGTGDWMLEMRISREDGVHTATAEYSFPLIGPRKEVPRGSFKVSIENQIPVAEKASIDEATITLVQQSDFVRSQGPEETLLDYQNYVDARTNFSVRSLELAAGSDGSVTFHDVPLYGLGPRSANTRLWYAIRITAGHTEEIDLNQEAPLDPEITATTFFIPELNTNLRPSEADPPRTDHFLVTPTDAFGAKNVLIADVRKVCETQYKDAEDTMQSALDAYLASPGTLTAANIEGIKRVLWAERVVRAAGDYSKEASRVAMSGLATVLGDLFDDTTNFKRADLKKRAKEREAIAERGAVKPEEFYSDLSHNWDDVIEAMELDSILAQGGAADIAKGMIKVSKQTYIDYCIEAGNDAEGCEKDAKIFTLVSVSVLNAISNRTFKGAAKSGVKTVIEEIVKAAEVPLFNAYCSSTAPDLSKAVNAALAWPTSSEQDYRDASEDVADILRELSTAAKAIGKAEAVQIAADGLDRGADFLELASNVAKPAAVFEKILKAAKYVYNATSIILPMTFIAGARSDVEEGTLAAFGQAVPALNTTSLLSAPAASVSGGAVVSALYARATSLKAAEWSIRLPLGNDDIPGAIEGVAGAGNANAYVTHLAAWTREVEQYKAVITATQATGTVGTLIADFMVADAHLKLANAEMLADLRELFVAIDTVTYTSPGSADYLVHRGSVASQLFLIRNKLDAFTSIVATLDSALAGQPVTAFVFSHVSILQSVDTGKEVISQPSEELMVTVALENLGAVDLNNVKARLVVYSPEDSVTMISSNELLVGTLAGGASTDVTWHFEYNGDLSGQSIALRIELLENDVLPLSFDFNEPHASIFVDPAISDQDGDNMPDSWEQLHGLNTASDDSAADLDLDGLTNLTEYLYGLDPNDSDSDNDNVSDGDELLGGHNGFLTDPLDPDSDDDLVNDGADAQPLDASITTASPAVEMGQLQLSDNKLVLTSTNLFEAVQVTNIGPGALIWSTRVDNDNVVLVTPGQAQIISGDGSIEITVPHYFDFDQAHLTKGTIQVFDVNYPNHASLLISVVIVGDNYVQGPEIFVDGFE